MSIGTSPGVYELTTPGLLFRVYAVPLVLTVGFAGAMVEYVDTHKQSWRAALERRSAHRESSDEDALMCTEISPYGDYFDTFGGAACD